MVSPIEQRHAPLLQDPFLGARISLGTARIIFCLSACLGYLQLPLETLIVLVLTLVSAYQVWRALDIGPPLLQVAGFIACLQWLLGPLLYYEADYGIEFQKGMYIDSATYFAYAITGTSLFLLRLSAGRLQFSTKELFKRSNRSRFLSPGLTICIASSAFAILSPSLPSYLTFVVYLISNLCYVGCILLFFYPKRIGKILCFFFLVPTLLGTAQSAMFHDLIIWSGILLSIWFSSRKRSRHLKVTLAIVAVAAGMTIQGLKSDYRAKVWSGERYSVIEEISNVWGQQFRRERSSFFENIILRINQGWIISAVLDHVPSRVPHAYGDTIEEAVVAALFPRYIAGSKYQAGDSSYMSRFTDVNVPRNTSMNISLLGEGWVNFGKGGGVVYVGIIALGIASAYSFACRRLGKNCLFLLLMPQVYFEVLKAETALAEILNHLVKSGVFCTAIFLITFYYAKSFYYPQVKLHHGSLHRTVKRNSQ